MQFLWSENSRNHQQKSGPMGPYELSQQVQTPSSQSNQVQ